MVEVPKNDAIANYKPFHFEVHNPSNSITNSQTQTKNNTTTNQKTPSQITIPHNNASTNAYTTPSSTVSTTPPIFPAPSYIKTFSSMEITVVFQ